MPSGETHYVLEDQVGFLLRLAYQRHIAIYASRTPGDITPVQFSMLYRLMHERAPYRRMRSAGSWAWMRPRRRVLWRGCSAAA